MMLDNAFVAQVKDPIIRTFQYLATDLQEDDLSAKQAMELTLDSNYLTTNGYPDADALVGVAIKEHGWKKVVNYLHKQIRL